VGSAESRDPRYAPDPPRTEFKAYRGVRPDRLTQEGRYLYNEAVFRNLDVLKTWSFPHRTGPEGGDSDHVIVEAFNSKRVHRGPATTGRPVGSWRVWLFCSTLQFPMNHKQEAESFTDSAVITADTVQSVRNLSASAVEVPKAVVKKGRKGKYSYTLPALQRATHNAALKPFNHEVALLVAKDPPLAGDMFVAWAQRATIAGGQVEVREKEGVTSVFLKQQYDVDEIVTSIGGRPGDLREVSSYGRLTAPCCVCKTGRGRVGLYWMAGLVPGSEIEPGDPSAGVCDW